MTKHLFAASSLRAIMLKIIINKSKKFVISSKKHYFCTLSM